MDRELTTACSPNKANCRGRFLANLPRSTSDRPVADSSIVLSVLRAGSKAYSFTPIICGALLTVAAWAAFWWLALPRHDICAMTRPAPAGCDSGRVPVAVLWSAVTAVLYGVVLFLAVKAPERRWRVVVLLGLITAVAAGYFSVLYA
jgi:hypothetical protein